MLLAFAVPAVASTGPDDAFASLKSATVTGIAPAASVKMAKQGADDPAGDDRGGGKSGKGRGGHDDGPGHA